MCQRLNVPTNKNSKVENRSKTHAILKPRELQNTMSNCITFKTNPVTTFFQVHAYLPKYFIVAKNKRQVANNRTIYFYICLHIFRIEKRSSQVRVHGIFVKLLILTWLDDPHPCADTDRSVHASLSPSSGRSVQPQTLLSDFHRLEPM